MCVKVCVCVCKPESCLRSRRSYMFEPVLCVCQNQQKESGVCVHTVCINLCMCVCEPVSWLRSRRRRPVAPPSRERWSPSPRPIRAPPRSARYARTTPSPPPARTSTASVRPYLLTPNPSHTTLTFPPYLNPLHLQPGPQRLESDLNSLFLTPHP